jgi:hypothetical protein
VGGRAGGGAVAEDARGGPSAVGEDEEEAVNPCDFYLAIFGLDLYLQLDTNTVYYTLSTLAQTLAGALAVLVAIVLFKYDRVDNLIGNGVALDSERKSPPSTKWRTRRSFVGKYAEPHKMAALRYYNATKVRPRLYRALGLSLLNVAACFAALPLSPMLLDNCWLAVIVLAATSVLGVVCLFFYWRLAIAVIGLG